MIKTLTFFFYIVTGTWLVHDGPDPVMHWVFSSRSVAGDTLNARLGPNANIQGELTPQKNDIAESLHFDGKTIVTVAENFRSLRKDLIPKKALTVSTWVSVEEGKDWGGIVGMVLDNADREKGWVVGYNHSHFYFGLATVGSDDGNGKMTYLESESRYEKGKLYHVVATYDGESMQLIVNGKVENESRDQSGDILYPESTPFVLGAYRDANEDFRHIGRVHDIAIYDIAAKPKWAAEEFAHKSQLARLPAEGVKPIELAFAVEPYLQYVTQNSITVMWETTKASSSHVFHGETAEVKTQLPLGDSKHIHEVSIKGLQPETQYFYKVVSADDEGKQVESEVRTFQTANLKRTPFAFAIVSDTQGNPAVSGKLAEYAWDQRPNFLLHTGDLVSTGTSDSQWKNQFFSSMNPLISRVAFFPVLGNHELNAKNYYNYVSLPDPEYYYKFEYGNTDFFMLDTNKNVGPESEQYQWLERELSASTATWKIVGHHHPAYSSDENDYGDLWKTNKSTRGDPRVKKLTKLYDKHNVDIVWCGHIHSYERTWCLRDGNVVPENEGPLYMITGGGGGHLETPGPIKPAFQNNVRRGHHYCMVAINGGTLEFKAFDIENRLFDYLKINK